MPRHGHARMWNIIDEEYVSMGVFLPHWVPDNQITASEDLEFRRQSSCASVMCNETILVTTGYWHNELKVWDNTRFKCLKRMESIKICCAQIGLSVPSILDSRVVPNRTEHSRARAEPNWGSQCSRSPMYG